MVTSTRNKKYFGRKPSPVKGKRVVKKAKEKAPTKASVKTNGNANATHKKKNTGVSYNVFNMPLSDSAATIDAASTCYHCQTGIGSCPKYSVVQVIETLVVVFSKEDILVLPVLRGVSDIDGTFL
jgi:hypothetical protein